MTLLVISVLVVLLVSAACSVSEAALYAVRRTYVRQIAEQGSIMPYEADLVRNVLHLDKVTPRDIMTPRPVVMKLPSDMTLREVFEKVKEFTNSRIPVYERDDPETWNGFVFSRDILSGLAKDQFDTKLEALCSPIYFVSERTPGHVLLRTFLKRRTHLFGVTDEYGDITYTVSEHVGLAAEIIACKSIDDLLRERLSDFEAAAELERCRVELELYRTSRQLIRSINQISLLAAADGAVLLDDHLRIQGFCVRFPVLLPPGTTVLDALTGSEYPCDQWGTPTSVGLFGLPQM